MFCRNTDRNDIKKWLFFYLNYSELHMFFAKVIYFCHFWHGTQYCFCHTIAVSWKILSVPQFLCHKPIQFAHIVRAMQQLVSEIICQYGQRVSLQTTIWWWCDMWSFFSMYGCYHAIVKTIVHWFLNFFLPQGFCNGWWLWKMSLQMLPWFVDMSILVTLCCF